MSAGEGTFGIEMSGELYADPVPIAAGDGSFHATMSVTFIQIQAPVLPRFYRFAGQSQNSGSVSGSSSP